jgi:AcrR family transcriptional regulator
VGEAGPRPLPRGRHHLSQAAVANSQRQRLIKATMQVVAGKGYAATTVANLTREAGVSRSTFYELFESKEDCFLASYDAAFMALVPPVALAFQAEERWPNRVRAGLATLLDLLASDPAQARLALVEVAAAGPSARARRRTAVQTLTPLLDEGRDFVAGRELPANASRMAAGTIVGLISIELVEGRAERLPDLLSDVLFGTLVVYLGPNEAAREVGGLTP